MKEIQVLEKKKRSLLSRILGLKEKVQKETDERTHKAEIEELVVQVKSVEDEIFDAMVSEARQKVLELETEANQLAAEKSGLETRTEEINLRLIEIFTACSAIIPKKRRQTTSKRTVVMQKTIEEREFTGFFERAVDAATTKPPYTITKRTLEIDVPAFLSQIKHAESLGYKLAPGEKVESEELNDENSVWMSLIPMPDILA